MKILVQKFGGTSVESYEKMNEICNIIRNYKEDEDLRLVVVVSAMGRKGAPYATDTLINLCKKVNENPNKRELDMIMSCGEIISGTILTSMLNNKNIKATFLTGGQAGVLTNGEFSNSKIVDINPQRILKELDQNKVVVIAGFQGISKDGEVTTLGRGGSDTSAVAIGKALKCEKVEIYTDVDGIMTADPRVEPNAKLLRCIDYEEVFQMADQGSKVIHPRAVQIAKSENITLVIKNTLNANCEGTKICLEGCSNGVCNCYEENTGCTTSVAYKDKIVQVEIKCSEEKFIDILSELANNKISIDMINLFINEKLFVVDEEDIDRLEDILENFNTEYIVNEECSKVTLICSKINGIPGVMARVLGALSKYNIELLQTSDSTMTISCLVRKNDMKKAVHAIHSEFYKN